MELEKINIVAEFLEKTHVDKQHKLNYKKHNHQTEQLRLFILKNIIDLNNKYNNGRLCIKSQLCHI